MSESDKPFTVKDRRHFTPEGHVREEPDGAAISDDSVGRTPATETERPAPPERGDVPSADAAEAPPGRSEPGSAPSEAGVGAEDRPAELGQFLLSLGAQAGMLLSGEGLPEGTDPREALAGARSIISILEMLKEKTAGRRTAREDEILEGLLYELRMAYVEKSRAGGS
jgi:hypothetical protein